MRRGTRSWCRSWARAKLGAARLCESEQSLTLLSEKPAQVGLRGIDLVREHYAVEHRESECGELARRSLGGGSVLRGEGRCEPAHEAVGGSLADATHGLDAGVVDTLALEGEHDQQAQEWRIGDEQVDELV